MKINLTDEGRAMLSGFVQGGTIQFTRAAFGNGNYQKLTDENGKPLKPQIVNEQKTAAFDAVPAQGGENVVKLKVTIDNTGLESGFKVTEIGYYAKLNDGEEQLYAIGNTDEAQADYIPPSSDRLMSIIYEGLVYIGDADVSAVLSENAQYVTAADFSKHLSDKSNPHEVTAEQVGLGLVPNVSTDDQTPNHTDTDKFENLVSGEKLSVALGKIKMAILKLMTHLNAKKGNPHNVTLADVGGASAVHTHDTSDLTSGILSVARGGTGLNAGANFNIRQTNPSNSGSGSKATCYGSTVLPGGLLIQWGHVNVDGHSFTVNFAKEFADTNYALVFPSCGSDFIPVWRLPAKETSRFTMTRTFGVDSAGLKKVLKAIFLFADESKIDSLFGASQAADWIAIGKAK